MRAEARTGYKFRLFLYSATIIGGVLAAFFFLGRYELIVVNSMALNVRTGPGISYEIQGQVTRGDTLTVLDKQNDWYKIELKNKTTGWVAAWLIKNQNTSAATNLSALVNTNNTKLREEPTTESTILADLSEGTVVTVTAESNGWSQVEYENQAGWINSTLLDLDPGASEQETGQTLYARENETNIREKPSINSSIVTQLNYGDKVKLIKTEGDWYEVQTSDGQVGYLANWVTSFTKPGRKNASRVSSISEAVIMLDPGHGGEDGGAKTSRGKLEKDVALSTAEAVKKELETTGAKVILTRSSDQTVSLRQRVEKSNRYKPDIFISLHYDSTEGQNVASGTTTYYYSEKRDKGVAEIINKHLKDDLPLENRGCEFGDLYVTRENTQTALLLELGYLNNTQDAIYAVADSYHKKVAGAITAGLTEYFK